jgi:hypothetical protein
MAAMKALLEKHHPMTVRQVFYQMTVAGKVAKLETEYKNVGRLLGVMREKGIIPFSWISDNTRWMRKPRSYDSVTDVLENAAASYRKALWADQKDYVEVWSEKDALAGVLYEVTCEFDIPLMVSKGFSSKSFLHETARHIAQVGKPAYLYYFGDHDPSGVHIDKHIERTLRKYAPNAEIHFEREAVLPWQIKFYKLPTRPTKKSDSRSKNFKGDSVEVDAIPPDLLREMVRHCIEKHIDKRVLEETRRVEQLERETLEHIAGQWGVSQ